MARRIKARLILQQLAAGTSRNATAKALGVSRHGIQAVAEAAEREGISWRDAEGMDEGELYPRLFPEKADAAGYPDSEGMDASTETICQAIHIQARGQPERGTSQQLRSGRTARRPRTAASARKPRLREPTVMVPGRPPEVEGRAVPGHWEGDLIADAANKGAMGTLAERSSRNVILPHLPDGHGSGEAQEAIVRKMAGLPKLMRDSLAWGQGSGMALHDEMSVASDMGVCFCDPHPPWRRGASENANGLLRQYFPKGADLSVYPEEHLDAVAEGLNDRPRETLGWRKPSEVFLELTNDSLIT